MRLLPRLLVSLGIALGLLYLLFKWGGVEWGDLASAVARLDLRTFGLAVGVHVCIYAVRSLRYMALIPGSVRPGFWAMMACSASHNLAAYVLPAKTGEATLVVYLRSLTGLKSATGLACLAVARLLDLGVLGAAVGAVLLALSPEYPQAAWMPAVGGAALGLGLVFLGLCLRPHLPAMLATRLLGLLGLQKRPLGAKLLGKAGEVTEALRGAAHGPRLLLGLGLTAGIWALVFLFYAVLARGTGMPRDLGYLEACLGSSLAVLFNLLPVNGFAGFGTQEAGWKIGFELVGIPGDLALSSGVAAHLVQLFNVVLFGFLGHLAMGLWRREAPSGADRGAVRRPVLGSDSAPVREPDEPLG